MVYAWDAVWACGLELAWSEHARGQKSAAGLVLVSGYVWGQVSGPPSELVSGKAWGYEWGVETVHATDKHLAGRSEPPREGHLVWQSGFWSDALTGCPKGLR